MKTALKYLLIAATWLATAWVAYGVVMANCEPEWTGLGGNLSFVAADYSQGWPLPCREYSELHDFAARTRKITRDRWRLLPAIANVSFAALIVGATVAGGIRWQRCGSFQFTLRGLFVLLTITAGLLALYERSQFWLLSWNLIAPLMLGLAAVMHWICWGVLEGAGLIARSRKIAPASAPHPNPLP
ncbi:hypothetical protein [Anatilimnocola floriformis]|uniref:hypothetical protein n=1 Tax=Anatilimnocola floriformis TaxID=2948575 RepID=UPI0020C3FDDA|nr:hypothetical protein [Anatilimnocola floriformis]